MTSPQTSFLLADPPSDPTVAGLVHAQAARQPEALALLAADRPALTYAQLWVQVQHIAQVLQSHGAGPAVRVAVMLPNGPERVSAFLGVATCAACVLLNPASRAAELRAYLADTQACIAIVDASERGPLREAADAVGLTLLEARIDRTLPAGRFDLTPSAGGRVETAPPARGRDVALEAPTLFGCPSIAELAQLVDRSALAHADETDKIMREIAWMSDEEVAQWPAQTDPMPPGLDDRESRGGCQ